MRCWFESRLVWQISCCGCFIEYSHSLSLLRCDIYVYWNIRSNANQDAKVSPFGDAIKSITFYRVARMATLTWATEWFSLQHNGRQVAFSICVCLCVCSRQSARQWRHEFCAELTREVFIIGHCDVCNSTFVPQLLAVAFHRLAPSSHNNAIRWTAACNEAIATANYSRHSRTHVRQKNTNGVTAVTLQRLSLWHTFYVSSVLRKVCEIHITNM